MRQLVGFMEAIRIRNTKKEYWNMSLHAKLAGAEIAPLEDVLGVASDESPFEEEQEAQFDELAKARFEERARMIHGGQ